MHRMFSDDLTSNSKFNKFELNPPTEIEVLKILKKIVKDQEISHLSDAQIVEIKNQSNKDLRSAIMTLQFQAAPKKY